MLNLASLNWFPVQLIKSSPLISANISWISLSLHLFDSIFDRSNSYKDSYLQIILGFKSNLLAHGHVIGKFEVSQPYLKLTESQNCFFDNSKLH